MIAEVKRDGDLKAYDCGGEEGRRLEGLREDGRGPPGI